MAKKWKPTIRQIKIYDELVRRQNAIRRWVLKRHKEAEREVGTSSRLPALVVPKRAYSSNRISFMRIKKEVFKQRIAEMRKLYGSLSDYLRPFKTNFLDALYRMIFSESGNYPLGGLEHNALFSKKQIEENPKYADFMHLYNRFATMNNEQFYDMYTRGFIVQLQFIYREMQGENKDSPFMQEQRELMSLYRHSLTKASGKTNNTYKESPRKSNVFNINNGKNK